MNAGSCAAIILAAGLSSRMGTFKPLLPLGEGTIADHVIDTFLQNGAEVYLVVGHCKSELLHAIKSRDINIVENPDYELGMFTSIQAGVSRLHTDCKWSFVMPVDIPLVRPSTVARLMIEARGHPDAIVYPVFAGRRGHPVLIPSRLIGPILQWEREGGLKALLSTDMNSVDVVVPDSNIVFDVDSPEDFRELLGRFQQDQVPTELECEVILNDVCRVATDVHEHCLKVAEVAVLIGRFLNKAGCKSDIETIRAAAMLHDVAKGHQGHDVEGGRMLKSMGFGRVGEIVATHTDLPDDGSDLSLESKVVFLADKFVKGTSLVTLDERYDSANRTFAAIPCVEAEVSRRKARALSVKRELELCLGYPLERIVF